MKSPNKGGGKQGYAFGKKSYERRFLERGQTEKEASSRKEAAGGGLKKVTGFLLDYSLEKIWEKKRVGNERGDLWQRGRFPFFISLRGTCIRSGLSREGTYIVECASIKHSEKRPWSC